MACHESNKSGCVVSVVGCSAGSCLDNTLWPKACRVDCVSQQYFYIVVNGLFPRVIFANQFANGVISKEVTVGKTILLNSGFVEELKKT